jgi:hypothetical protein
MFPEALKPVASSEAVSPEGLEKIIAVELADISALPK